MFYCSEYSAFSMIDKHLPQMESDRCALTTQLKPLTSEQRLTEQHPLTFPRMEDTEVTPSARRYNHIGSFGLIGKCLRVAVTNGKLKSLTGSCSAIAEMKQQAVTVFAAVAAFKVLAPLE